MSIFATIIKDMSSWASKFEHLLAEFEGKAPAIEKVMAATLTFVGPILQTIVTLTAGAPTAALVAEVVSKAQSDLAAVNGLVTAIGPTSSVASILDGVASDLSALLPAAGITDSATVAKVSLVINELNALVGAFPPSTVTTATVSAAAAAGSAATPATEASAPANPTIQAGPGLHNVVAA